MTPRRIKWKRSNDGYCSSHCGRWSISPLYCGCVNPQFFELSRNGKVVSSMHANQREAKDDADHMDELAANTGVTY